MLIKEYRKLSREQQKKVLRPSRTEEGIVYKIEKQWSEMDMNEVAYVPEQGYDEEGYPIDVYTKKDFIKACEGYEDRAEMIFYNVTWSAPETLYIETEWDEEDLEESADIEMLVMV